MPESFMVQQLTAKSIRFGCAPFIFMIKHLAIHGQVKIGHF